MEKYSISKTDVLNLLREAGVTIRRQPMTQSQLAKAAELYTGGSALVAVSKRIGVPPETIRRGLIETGVQTRGRGGSRAR